MRIELPNKIEKAITELIISTFQNNKHTIKHIHKDSVIIEPNIKSNTSGMYCLFIHDIPMYFGESGVNLRQRITRWAKVLLGQEHETEKHSLGEDLKRLSEEYNIVKQWFVNNMTVSYLSMKDARSFFEGYTWTNSTVFGPETYTIKDFSNKDVVTYFEKLMIKKIGPISNRSGNETSQARFFNYDKFRKLLESMSAKKAA